MRIFFNCKFTGLHKNTTLISIGLVTEGGGRFYAELTDYSRCQLSEFDKRTVLPKLWATSKSVEDLTDINYYHIGNQAQIAEELNNWLSKFDNIQFVGDVGHYGFVLLIDLLAGSAIDLRKGICPAYHDINTDIAEHYNITEAEAFDINREQIICESRENKMNAMHDACVISEIYNHIKGVE